MVYAWLLGTTVDKGQLANLLPLQLSPPTSPRHGQPSKSDTSDSRETHSCPEPPYFEAYSKVYIVSAMKMIIKQASLSARHGMFKADCVLPYRLLRALVDKPELALPILNDVMLDLICCLKQQIANLGGLGSAQMKGVKPVKFRGMVTADDSSKKTSKKGVLRAEILQSSNLFFTSLDSEILWKWVIDLLKDSFHQVGKNNTSDKEASASKSEGDVVTVARERETKEENSDLQEAARSLSPPSELVKVQEAQLPMRKDTLGQLETVQDTGNDQPVTDDHSPRTNQVRSSVGSNGDKQSLSFVLDLVKFLIQSLTLVSGIDS